MTKAARPLASFTLTLLLLLLTSACSDDNRTEPDRLVIETTETLYLALLTSPGADNLETAAAALEQMNTTTPTHPINLLTFTITNPDNTIIPKPDLPIDDDIDLHNETGQTLHQPTPDDTNPNNTVTIIETLDQLARDGTLVGVVAASDYTHHLPAIASRMNNHKRPLLSAVHTDPQLLDNLDNTYWQLQASDELLAQAAVNFFFHKQKKRRLLTLSNNNPQHQAKAQALEDAWAQENDAVILPTLSNWSVSIQTANQLARHACVSRPDLLFLAIPKPRIPVFTSALQRQPGCKHDFIQRPRPFALLLSRDSRTPTLLLHDPSRQTYFLSLEQAPSPRKNDFTGQHLNTVARTLHLSPYRIDWQYTYDAVTAILHNFNHTTQTVPFRTIINPDLYLDHFEDLTFQGLSGPIRCMRSGACSTQTAIISYQPASQPFDREEDLTIVYRSDP